MPLLRSIGCKPETNLWQAGCKSRLEGPTPQQGVAGMNAIKLLKKDHSAVQSLFTKFDRTSKSAYDKRADLFEQMRRELQVHSRVEQEMFYPAVKALNGEGRRLISEALKEHKEIEELLAQISRL